MSTEVESWTEKACPTIGIAISEMEKQLEGYLNSIDPEEHYPDDVNQLKPHHIRVIGAMGDSLTIGSRAQNRFEPFTQRYPGNSYFTGADFPIEEHLTIYNIFRFIASKTGQKLLPGSQGIDYGPNTMFNVAVGGMTCRDLSRQAEELCVRMLANREVVLEEDWKMITLWIGTNDVGTLGRREFEPISGDEYKHEIEKALTILKNQLPRTIVMLIGAFQPELLIEAESIMKDGLPSSFHHPNTMRAFILASLAIIASISAVRVRVASEAFAVAIKETIRMENIISSKDHHQVEKLFAPEFVYESCDGRVGRRAILRYLSELKNGLKYRTTVVAARFENHRKNLHFTVDWIVGNKHRSEYEFVAKKTKAGVVLVSGKAIGCEIRGDNLSIAEFLSVY